MEIRNLKISFIFSTLIVSIPRHKPIDLRWVPTRMQDSHTTNPLIQRIILLLIQSPSSSSITVTFLWILDHINFPEHDAVDLTAKNSLLSHTISDPILTCASDLKIYYCSLILDSWHNHWKNQNSIKFRTIKDKPVPWSSLNRTSRHEEVIFPASELVTRVSLTPFPS